MMAGQTAAPDRALVRIDTEHCKVCDLCVVACPHRNLRLSSGYNRSGYHPVEFHYRGDRGECTACGLCYWVCPDYAITEVAKLRP